MNPISLFKLEKHNITVKKELLAGNTTFFAMSYIIFVNPEILAQTGKSYDGLFAATIIVAASCTLLMALFANAPFAVAPGMGATSFLLLYISLFVSF